MSNCQALGQEIKTSEPNAQMLMQAVLKEAFEGEKFDPVWVVICLIRFRDKTF
jgi:hypothetical protein